MQDVIYIFWLAFALLLGLCQILFLLLLLLLLQCLLLLLFSFVGVVNGDVPSSVGINESIVGRRRKKGKGREGNRGV